MRTPLSCWDRGLLEDEPFLSAFKARRLAAPPRRSTTDEFDRNRAIAMQLQNMNLVDTVVQIWLNFAFQFPDRCSNNKDRQVPGANDPGMLHLFVRFYWALCQSDNCHSAAAVLQQELRRRGFGYVSHPTKSLGSTADLTKLKMTLPPGLNFRKNLTAKKDMPGCSEQKEKSFPQTCPPCLDPTSFMLSETRDLCHIELNSSTLPLPPESQNGTAVCDLVKTGKRRQTSPDSRCVKHRKFNEATSDTSKLCNVSNASISTNSQKLLCANPPIWAQTRQEVCETLDWFRSYQGGVYFAHNMAKGYLLSAFSSQRDRFEHDGKLIISHGGGKAESLHTRKGRTVAQPATDQLAEDKSVRALLNNYRNQRPLVLLIDDKYVLFPYNLGAKDITYVVLGFYTIAHAWAERQPANNETGYVVRYKFAFRWCDDQGLPWWNKETNLSNCAPPSTTFSSEPTAKRRPKKLSANGEGAVSHSTMIREAASSKSNSFVCRLCHMDSPHVYTWAWLCLHPECSGFWKDIKGNLPPDNLEYELGFLELKASLPVPPDFGKLKPDPPSGLLTNRVVTSYASTRGFHCNSCGRLSCRSKWEKWECRNCGEYLPVSRPPHEAKDFWGIVLPVRYRDHFISNKSNISQLQTRCFGHENGIGTITSFILPDGRGQIHHIQPGTPSGKLEADAIFIEYQQQATAGELKFRRWPLRTHKCRGALLTNYFSQNSGEPYKYVGGAANTVPFENAPGAVVKARALIQKRIQQALNMHIEFNEILSAAYMEKQKMAFHSDSEIGLGPVVAGLSLGSPALMHFRIHAKHDPMKELKGNLLSFALRHGDVLVMDGASVQEYYEHTVIPSNFRIAATARQINPNHA